MKMESYTDILEGRTTVVVLSRRNLETLLSKLNDPRSNKTLYRHTSPRDTLVVTVEENDPHYGDRIPGCVHPDHEPSDWPEGEAYTPAPDPQDFSDPLEYTLALGRWERGET